MAFVIEEDQPPQSSRFVIEEDAPVQKELVAPKISFGQRAINDLRNFPKNLRNAFETAVEPIATIGSAAVAAPIAGLSGVAGDIYSGITGSPRIGREVQSDVMKAMTYQPRNPNAQAIVSGLGEALDKSKLAGLPVVGSELPMLAQGARQAVSVAKPQMAVNAAKTAELAANESRLNSLRIEAANKAQKYGIALNPAESNPTTANTIKSGLVGSDEIGYVTSKANEAKWPELARKDLGFKPTEQLTRETYDRARLAASKPYAEISLLPEFATDQVYLSNIRGKSFLEGLSPEVQDILAGSKKVDKLIEKASLEKMTGREAVELVKQLRSEASSVLGANEPKPGAVALAKAKQNIAYEIEGLVGRRLEEIGNTTLAKQFADSRAYIAKTYAYQNATNTLTGKIDPLKIAKMADDKALSGIISDIADIAGNFPSSSRIGANQNKVNAPRLTRAGVGGTLGFATGTMFGNPVLGAAAGAVVEDVGRTALANRLVSPSSQLSNLPRDMRPLRERMGYSTEIPVEKPPLSLAPTGADILPPVSGGAGYQGRGLLSLADETATNTPVRVPVQEFPLEPRLRAMYERGGIQQPPTIPSGPYKGSLPLEVNPMPVLPEAKQAQTPFPLLFSMAEEAPFIPGSRGSSLSFGERQATPPLPRIQYNERGLLSFAEEPKAQTKAAEMPSINFELRQEFLQRPEIVSSINAFREEAAKLQQVVDNAISPAVRDSAKSSLTALQNEFLAGMKMMGVEKPQDAIGLVKMYESGRTRLPIVKTFDPRQKGLLQ